MNYLIVRLWGEELGRLVWNPTDNTTYFMFNPNSKNRPDVSPLMHPVGKWNISLPVPGDSRRIYNGLPPFIADSLPDSWGNKLFDKWLKQNHISRSKVTPLFKLMFIGKRGMGALEFEPAANDLEHSRSVDLNALYKLSLNILEERESVSIDTTDEITMQSLLAVGTSAGGRQMKAIVAIHPDNHEVRSGQARDLNGYEHYIIKFKDKILPSSEIEMAFYDMAKKCGINMEESRLINIEGVNHFMTRRFDRKDGEKIYMQTLAAINPEADSYEDIMSTCRDLDLSETELIELYRRMVFNVLANNTDDHNKNFSFLLEKGKKWHLSPAYDLTFIFDRYGAGPDPDRCMSIYGNTQEISKEELLDFGKENNIRNTESIITDVAEALSRFPILAEKYQIPQRWKHIIHKTLLQNLEKFGYISRKESANNLTDSQGRKFAELSVYLNQKRIYQVSATIDGIRHKRFIKPTSTLYSKLQQYETNTLTESEFLLLMEDLFPP